MSERPSVREVLGVGRVRPPGASVADADMAVRQAQQEAQPGPPVEQPAPPSGRTLPCPNCGAGMAYSPGVEALHCDHCSYHHKLPERAEEIEELDFEKFARHGDIAEQVLAGAELEVRCGGCGAVTQMPANMKTDSCPFCGGHLKSSLESAKPALAPGGVLPFTITKPQAKGAFKKWVESRWFAPNAFKRLAELDALNGLYVPHWTYDAMTFTIFSGERGDYYYVTVGTGKNRRRERRIRWTPVGGRLDHWFDDVLVCASRSLPPELVRRLAPWNLKQVRPYDGSFLAGFRTERYQISAVQGHAKAREIMESEIQQRVRRRIGGDTQRVHFTSTEYDGITFKLILLPVWVSAYQWRGKPKRVAINAQTGEVSGERPWSWIKIALASIAGTIAVALLVQFLITTS